MFRFFAVSTVLSNMVVQLVETPSHRLLKHIIRCYLRLSDNPRFANFASFFSTLNILSLFFNFIRSFTDSVFVCYLFERRSREALKQCLPEAFRDGSFALYLKDASDLTTKRWLSQVMLKETLCVSIVDFLNFSWFNESMECRI